MSGENEKEEKPLPSVELMVSGVEFTESEVEEIEAFISEIISQKLKVDDETAKDIFGISSAACVL